MSESYLGEIRLFAGSYVPRDWAFCDGQLLSIQWHTALYSLLGTTYGGDGYRTFALPDMRGRLPIHQGEGPGLTPRTLGESFGEAGVTLTEEQIPSHNHPMRASATEAKQRTPQGAVLATTAGGLKIYRENSTQINSKGTKVDKTKALSPKAMSETGSNAPHTNSMPTLGLNFIICLKGIYPPKTPKK